MHKINKNIICIFSLVFLFAFICSDVLYAENGIKKGGYNKLPSKGPVIKDNREGMRIIDKSLKSIFTPDVEMDILKNNLRVSKPFDTITFGSYEQDNIIDNGKEPIEWIVVTKNDDGKVLLTSKYILDCQKFNSYPAPVTWERSTLRQWLNNDFFDEAFSEIEKANVLEVINQNKKNHYYNTECGNPTCDKVFCLSIEEATMYFEGGDDYYLKQQNCLNPNEKRKCQPTPYAKDRGVRVSNHIGIGYDCGNYWLRTLGKNEEREWYSGIFAKYFAAIVQEPGYIKPMGTAVHSSDDGVRPCIWLDSN